MVFLVGEVGHSITANLYIMIINYHKPTKFGCIVALVSHNKISIPAIYPNLKNKINYRLILFWQ